MKIVLSTLAAAMIASASFAGVALADGDYYEGVSKAAAQVDHVKTSSVDHANVNEHRDAARQSVFEPSDGVRN